MGHFNFIRNVLWYNSVFYITPSRFNYYTGICHRVRNYRRKKKCLSTLKLNAMFSCLWTQAANQPITWQQVNAFRQLEVVNTTCQNSKWASTWGSEGIQPDGLVRILYKLQTNWDFYTKPSLEFAENGTKIEEERIRKAAVVQNLLRFSLNNKLAIS